MGTVEFFFLFPPDEKTKSPKGKGGVQGHKAMKSQSWDFNQGSHAHNYQAVLPHTNSLKTSLTKISTSCAKFPSLKVKQSTSRRPHAEFALDESHAILGCLALGFRI